MAKSFIISLLALGRALAAPATAPALLAPSRDPWYRAPPNFEFAKPGHVFRIRAAGADIVSAVNASSAYNILYRTTNSFNGPTWAVTTLYLPSSATDYGKDKKPALLSYQIPYDSDNVDFSPSYALRFANSTGISDIAGALSTGLFVNVPDFEGPSAAFTAGVLAGHSVLDSIRASLSAQKGLDHDSATVLWGFSGGSQASEFAAELQKKYAPELNIIGAALGGVVVNMMDVIESINATPLAGIIPNALLGIAAEYPNVKKYLLSKLKKSGPQNATTFLAAAKNSFLESVNDYGGIDFYTYFIGGKTDVVDAPVIKEAMQNDGIMGTHAVPQFPLFIYTAIADEVSPINDTEALVKKYCASGADLRWERNTVGGHVSEEENGDARAMAWLIGILDGSLGDCETKGCVIEDVTLNTTSSPV